LALAFQYARDGGRNLGLSLPRNNSIIGARLKSMWR
jgi:hypothetical protein